MRNPLIHLMVLAVLSAGSNLYATGPYEVIALPLPPSTMGSDTFAGMSPIGLNALGQIAFVGYYQAPSSDAEPVGSVKTVAMLFQNGQYTFLPVPSVGISAQAVDISDGGTIVGSVWAGSQSGVQYPVVWNGGIAVPLPMGSYVSGIAYTVNSSGAIGGLLTMEDFDDQGHAVWWESNGTLHDLGDFGASSAAVRAINDKGQMLVDTVYPDHSNTLLLNNGVIIQEISGATRLNNAGHALVGGGTSTGFPQYSLWNGSAFIVLPALDGDLSGLYYGLNDCEQAVGVSTSFDGSSDRAILWDNGTAYELNTLLLPNSGWRLTSAAAIAADGSIVGAGYLDGQFSYYLATPTAPASTPEPATAGALLLGGIILLRRRGGRVRCYGSHV